MYTHKYSTYTHMEAMTRGAEGCVCRTNRLDCSCCARNTKSSGPPIHQHIYIYCITAMDNTNTAAYGGGTFCFSRSLALTL